MYILAVDTNSFAGSTALLKGNRLLVEVNMDSPLTHSERLLPAVEFMLKSTKLEMTAIDGFALAVGPGSFTGIRIGMSTVKSFAYATGKPVAPVSNLTALALKLRHPQNRLLCPVLDAKKNEIYAGLFESKFRSLKEVIPQGIYSPDSFLSLLPAHRIIHFIGMGAVVYKDKIIQYIRDKARFSMRSFFIAYEVGLLGWEMLNAGKGKDFRDIEPLYFRKSQAEEIH